MEVVVTMAEEGKKKMEPKLSEEDEAFVKRLVAHLPPRHRYPWGDVTALTDTPLLPWEKKAGSGYTLSSVTALPDSPSLDGCDEEE